jgi:hypothetical protein
MSTNQDTIHLLTQYHYAKDLLDCYYFPENAVKNSSSGRKYTKAVIRRYFLFAHAQSDEDRSDLNFEREEQLAAYTKRVIRRYFDSAHAQSDEDRSDLNFEREEHAAGRIHKSGYSMIFFLSAHAQSDEDRSDLNFEQEEQLAAYTKAVIRRFFSFRACAE